MRQLSYIIITQTHYTIKPFQYETQILFKIGQPNGTRTEFIGLGKVFKSRRKCLGRIVTFFNCFTSAILASHPTQDFSCLSISEQFCLYGTNLRLIWGFELPVTSSLIGSIDPVCLAITKVRKAGSS